MAVRRWPLSCRRCRPSVWWRDRPLPLLYPALQLSQRPHARHGRPGLPGAGCTGAMSRQEECTPRWQINRTARQGCQFLDSEYEKCRDGQARDLTPVRG